MRRENWPDETTIVDEGRHNVEVPVINEIFFCPHGNCKKRFRLGDDQKFIHHRSQAHDIDHSISKECDYCGETFPVEPSKDDQQYCSIECSNKSRSQRIESRESVIRDIRDYLEEPADTDSLAKDELVQIREKLATSIEIGTAQAIADGD